MHNNNPDHFGQSDLEDQDNEEAVYLDGGEEFDFEMIPEHDEIVAEEEPEENVTDESTFTFTGHKSALSCCVLNSQGTLAATGGEDDRGYLWDVQTGEVLIKSEEHKDTVSSVGFSFDEKFVAFGDMADESEGVIKVYNVETRALHHTIKDLTNLHWIEWHESKSIILGGQSTGDCIFVNLLSKCQKYWSSGKYTPCIAGTFIGNSFQAVIAFDDGSLQFWDAKEDAPLVKIEGNGEMITTIAKSPDNTMIATGDTDWSVNLYLIMAGKDKPFKKIHSWRCSDPLVEDEADRSIESVSFSPDGRYLCAALLTGVIIVYDKRTKAQRVVMRNQEWLSKCIWDPVRPLLYVSNLSDGSVTVFNSNNGVVDSQHKGPHTDILDLCYNKNKNIILIACEDAACRIFSCK